MDIDINFDEINLFTESDKKIVDDINNTDFKFDNLLPVVNLFEKQALESSDDVAVVHNGGILTYRQLNEKTNQVANILSRLKKTTNQHIIIFTDRNFKLFEAVLGVLKSGSAYVPVDPGYPKGRIKYIFNEIQCRVIVTEEKYLGALKEYIDLDDIKVVCLDTVETSEVADIIDNTQINKASKKFEICSRMSDTAYIIYTSGSTGHPKGVMVANEAISNTLLWMKDFFKLNASDNIAQKTSISFTDSVWEILLPLICGARAIIIDDSDVRNPKMLLSQLKTNKITLTQFVPPLLHALLETVERIPGGDTLPDLKYFINGGEALSVPLVQRWFKSFPDIKIANIYGMTESAIYATYHILDHLNSANLERVPVGKPIANTRVYILNQNKELCDLGVTGEICIEGVNLANGYWKKQDVTDEVFIQNPVTGARLYCTGDVGFLDKNGVIQYVGRKDDQVQIRGYRVEIKEVEHAVGKINGIDRAYVLAKRNQFNTSELICAYTLRSNNSGKIDVGQFKKELGEFLPGYMIPDVFHRIETVPLTVNGKVDKSKILEMINAGEGCEGDPDNNDDITKKLITIIETVLSAKNISVDDNIFNIGGNSLNAMFILSSINKEFKVNLELINLFEYRTINKLSDYMKSLSTDNANSLIKVDKKEYYKVSIAQQRIYILYEMEKTAIQEQKSSIYNITAIVSLKGKCDTDRLNYCINKIIERHESLRTSFHIIDKEPMQKIHNKIDFSLDIFKSGSKDQTDRIIDDYFQIFELDKLPLFKIGIIKTSETEHLLLLNMHHIIADGYSLTILMNDLMLLYDGEVLEKLEYTYKDFSDWQRKAINDELKEDTEFWKNMYSDGIPKLNLGTDYERPSLYTFESDKIDFTFDADITSRIRELAKAQDVSVYIFLYSLFNILLFKLSMEEEIVIGSVTASRKYSEYKSIIGLFYNTIAIKTRISPDAGFIKNLKSMAKIIMDSFNNQFCPFETVLENLNLDRNMDRNPLFDVMFIFDNIGMSDFNLSGLTAKPYKFDAHQGRTLQYDIVLFCREMENELKFSFNYYSSIFKRESISRYVMMFKSLVKSIVNDVSVKIKDIDLLNSDERKLIFSSVPERKIGKYGFIDLFRQNVEKYNTKPAIRHNQEMITYDELDIYSDNLAGLIQDTHYAHQMPVAVFLDRSVELITAITAIFKLKGIYVPIDTKNPNNRIEYIIKNAGIKTIITKELFYDKIYAICQKIDSQINVVILNRDDLVQRNETGFELKNKNDFSFDDIAYIIYTSGTTGDPKGALVHHGGMLNHMMEKINLLSLDQNDIIAQTASVSFDISIWQMLNGLLTGSTVCIFDEGMKLDFEKVINYLINKKITIAEFVPSYISTMLNFFDENNRELLKLRYILTTGEEIKVPIANKWYSIFPEIKLINAYGPTEASDDISHFIIEDSLLDNCRRIPIGKPIQNSQIYIIDRYNKLVPSYVRGEICVAGICVGKGYINDNAKTEEVFVENPFMDYINNDDFKKMYKTGDVGRYLPDGTFEFFGRLDHQVKIRGYRIELGEIEKNIQNYGNIEDAKVILKKESEEKNLLLAFFVADKEIDIDGLKYYLLENLPQYMIPNSFLRIDKFPYNINGKIDQKKLLEYKTVKQLSDDKRMNSTEEQIAKIWSEMLNIDAKTIRSSSNFFALGGNSLTATLLVNNIHKSFGVKLNIIDFFKRPVLTNLGEYLSNMTTKKFTPFSKAEEKEYYDLSITQRRLYFMYKLYPQDTSYNISAFFDLKGNIDVSALEMIFSRIISRHEALRTSFRFIDNSPRQKICKNVPFKIEKYVMEEDQVVEDIIPQFVRPFELESAPLLRVGLAARADKTGFLMLDIHHIIGDTISLKIIVNEFIALYNNEELPAVKFQYKDFSEWQNENMSMLMEQKEFWLSNFKDKPKSLNLPVSRSREQVKTNDGDFVEFQIDKSVMDKIKFICKENNITVFIFLISAYYILLSKVCGQNDICSGIPVGGRRHSDTQSIVGFFVNLLVLRIQVDNNLSYMEYLMQFKDKFLKALDNQDYPFENLVEDLKIERMLNRNPLFDACFLYNNEDYLNISLSDLTITQHNYRNDKMKFDIHLQTFDSNGRYKFVFDYKAMFDRDTIEFLISDYQFILETAVKDTNVCIDDIKIPHQFETGKKLEVEFPFDF